METNLILAANLKALMEHRYLSILDIVALGKQKHVPVTNGTVGRIHAGKYVGMEKVADLATALGLETWQLLVPGLDPTALPRLGDETAIEKAVRDRLRKLADTPALDNELPAEPARKQPSTPKREQLIGGRRRAKKTKRS